MKLDIRQFSTLDENFEGKLQDTLSRGAEFDPEIDRAVRAIIDQVICEGDSAVVELTGKFDQFDAESVEDLEISADELAAAAERLDPPLTGGDTRRIPAHSRFS